MVVGYWLLTQCYWGLVILDLLCPHLLSLATCFWAVHRICRHDSSRTGGLRSLRSANLLVGSSAVPTGLSLRLRWPP